jgi:hypothetical protein
VQQRHFLVKVVNELAVFTVYNTLNNMSDVRARGGSDDILGL